MLSLVLLASLLGITFAQIGLPLGAIGTGLPYGLAVPGANLNYLGGAPWRSPLHQGLLAPQPSFPFNPLLRAPAPRIADPALLAPAPAPALLAPAPAPAFIDPVLPAIRPLRRRFEAAALAAPDVIPAAPAVLPPQRPLALPPPPAPHGATDAAAAAAESASTGTSVQSHSQDELGGYHFNYITPDGQYREETKTPDGTIVGRFGYWSPDGQWIERNFVADDFGVHEGESRSHVLKK